MQLVPGLLNSMVTRVWLWFRKETCDNTYFVFGCVEQVGKCWNHRLLSFSSQLKLQTQWKQENIIIVNPFTKLWVCPVSRDPGIFAKREERPSEHKNCLLRVQNTTGCMVGRRHVVFACGGQLSYAAVCFSCFSVHIKRKDRLFVLNCLTCIQ